MGVRGTGATPPHGLVMEGGRGGYYLARILNILLKTILLLFSKDFDYTVKNDFVIV